MSLIFFVLKTNFTREIELYNNLNWTIHTLSKKTSLTAISKAECFSFHQIINALIKSVCLTLNKIVSDFLRWYGTPHYYDIPMYFLSK